MGDTVSDSETPARALDAGAEALRRFSHLSGRHFDERAGWEYPSDAYDCVGALTSLASRLPQVFEQLVAAVRDQHELHLIDIDKGHPYEGDPGGALEALSVAMDRARVAAQQMLSSLDEAQEVFAGMSYGGPDSRPGEWP